MVAGGVNRSAATRYLRRTEEQARYGRESRRHGYQGIKEKVEGLRRQAEGQGLGGVREVGVYPLQSRLLHSREKQEGKEPLGV